MRQPSSHASFEVAAPSDEYDANWIEEIEMIRESLELPFGSVASQAMMKKWGLTKDRRELHAISHETNNGQPLGYEFLSLKAKASLDTLLAANKEMKVDNMEVASGKLKKYCGETWKHVDVYLALAVAESGDDCEFVVRTLLSYAERMAPEGAWDPAVLLVAARAQPSQQWQGRTGNVKRVLLSLYKVLFEKQAVAFMSRQDLDYLDSLDVQGGSLFLLTQHDSAQPMDVKQMWVELKRMEGIQSAAMDALMEYVGINGVKQQALAILKKMLSDRRLTEKQRVMTSCNFTFMGNPGTGKTCVARIFANMLFEAGMRSKNVFVETTGQELVQNGAIKADKVIESAMDGVLFIDEAHSLDPKSNKAEGSAIVTKLLKAAEDSRDRLTIILAGYRDAIEDKLYASDLGFRSRFEDIVFEDFSEQELRKIFVDMVEKKDWKFHPENPLLVDVVTARIARGRCIKGFGNARTVRSTLERGIKAASIANRAPYLKIEDFLGPPPDTKHLPALASALEELEEMTGLDSEKVADGTVRKGKGIPAKVAVRQLVAVVQGNYHKEINGEKPLPLALNRLFLGNPGTGKTTVATIYGKILKALQLLSNGSVVLKTGGDFIAGHEGGTQEKTIGILAAAVGKVLVIDEAYMLNDANYGKIALDTIVSKVMGSPGEDMAVMMLGYEEQMLKMIREQNPGLARRFNPEEAFFFPDFDDGQLLSILKSSLRKLNLSMDRNVREKAIELLAAKRRMPRFGNAGDVNNLLDKAYKAMSARDQHTRTVCIEDLGESAREAGSGGDPMDNLKGMFMIENVVEQLVQIRARIELQRRQGEEVLVNNFLFVGNPGTGKTQVARVMSKLMHSLGILEDRIVETTGLEIQAGYVGQSQGKAREKIDAACGGVLFVDEAHNLGNSPFAVEAAKVLMTATLEEQHKGRTMIIFAGYEGAMNQMMQRVDPGFRRRFQETIHFPDWTPQNCFDFVLLLCKRNDMQLADDAQEHIVKELAIIHQRPGWGNASDAHYTFELLKSAFARRTMQLQVQSSEVQLITLVDAVLAMSKFHQNRPPMEAAMQDTMSGFAVGVDPSALKNVALDCRPKTHTELKSRETEANEKMSHVLEAQDGGDDDDDIFAALQKACVELGYDKDQNSRKRLLKILESVQMGEGFPDDILGHVRNTTGVNETKLTQVLKPQVPLLFKSILDAFTAEEARLDEIRRLEALQKAQEADALRRKHEAMLQKLQVMGLCPAGFSWYRQGGGWRCNGGSHWVSDMQLR